MAFSISRLQPIGATSRGGLEGDTPGDNNTSVWQYSSTSDNLTVIQTAAYFNDVRDIVNAGDILWIVAAGPVLRTTFFTAAAKSPAVSDVTVSSAGNTATT